MADQTTTEKREPFEINLEEHFDFAPIASSRFITSNEFAKLTSELFKSVFADYEGCIFEVNGNEPTIALVANHGDYTGDDRTRLCDRLSTKSVGSTVIDRGRARDTTIKDGDRYYLTDDGKDVVKDLIVRRLFNNGKPDFRNIVSDFTDRGPVNSYFSQQTSQYTKVSYLSLDKLCGLLFGSKDPETGDQVEYSVSIASIYTPGVLVGTPIATNYILNITQVSSKNIAEFCNKIGLGQQGLNIVR